MLVLSITVCEIILFDSRNVLNLNLTLKVKVKDVEDLDEN